MHSQLQLVADEYTSAQARLHELVRAVPEERWGRRADPARWSVAECVAHLNLTSMAYLPLLQHAVSRARMLERRPPGRYHRDPIGWVPRRDFAAGLAATVEWYLSHRTWWERVLSEAYRTAAAMYLAER